MKIFQNKPKQVTHIIDDTYTGIDSIYPYGASFCGNAKPSSKDKVRNFGIDFEKGNFCSACVGRAYKAGLIKFEVR